MSETAEDGPWITEEAVCEWCDKEWVAVHPCAMKLECPNCHQLTPSLFAKECEAWEIQQGEAR